MTCISILLSILSNICLPTMAGNPSCVTDRIQVPGTSYEDMWTLSPDSLRSGQKQEVLEESVVISSRGQKQIEGIMAGNLKLNAAALEGLPRFLGTADILKTLQLMPGVITSGEMDSGIYIRGGDPGQNLIMIDGANIYSPSHLMGFFSIFNSDHISSATIYKSGIPARYGGCASGVLDIRTANSVKGKVEGVLNIGMISSNGTLALPVGKKSQITVSGRGTYINYILKGMALAMRQSTEMPKYGFQDYNVTWITEFNESSTLKVNGYYGLDRLHVNQTNYGILASMFWHNIAASAIWDRHPAEGLKSSHIVSFSRFSNNIGIERATAFLHLPSDISGIAYKGNITAGFR